MIGNVNEFHRPIETTPQTWQDPRRWLVLSSVGTVVLTYVPTRPFLSRWTSRWTPSPS